MCVSRRCVITLLWKLNCKIPSWVIAEVDWVAEPSKISEVRAKKNSCCADTLWIWNLMLRRFPGKVSQHAFVVVSGTGRGIAHEFGECSNTPRAEGVCAAVCTYMYQILRSKITAGKCIFHGLPVHWGSQLTAYESNNVRLKCAVEGKFQVWPSKHLSTSKLFSAIFLWSYFLGDLLIKWAFI